MVRLAAGGRLVTAAAPRASAWAPGATRAMNLSLAETDVVAVCKQKGVRISAIETLRSGGTHLVCITIEEADEARILFKKAIIAGPVQRFAFQRMEPSRHR